MEIPTRCQNCPAVSIEKKQIDTQSRMIDGLISSAMGDAPDRYAQLLFEKGQREGSDTGIYSLDSPEAIASQLRSNNAAEVERMNEQITQCEDRIVALTDNCGGTLGMRAVRDGVQYTARICTSPFIVDLDPTIARPTFVEYKDLSDS